MDGGREKWGPIWGKMHMLRRVAECMYSLHTFTRPHMLTHKRREVARAVLFLCSVDASFITATDLPVDGGYLALSAEGLGEFSNFAGTKQSASGSAAGSGSNSDGDGDKEMASDKEEEKEKEADKQAEAENGEDSGKKAKGKGKGKKKH